MNIHDATEQAYRNGYTDGFADGSSAGEPKAAEWVFTKYIKGKAMYKCSSCDRMSRIRSKYCPHCGYEMKGRANESIIAV